MHYNNKFYLLANKHNKKLGYFLLELDEDLKNSSKTELMKRKNSRYLIKWVNKLNIGEGNLEVLERKHVSLDKNDKEITKISLEMVISFKTIHENTYTVLVVDIKSARTIFKHTSYQLWESPVKGFLNTKTNDFIILNKFGTHFIRLDHNKPRRRMNVGREVMVHSLGSINYMKIEEGNIINFEFAKSKHQSIEIQQQYIDSKDVTSYEDVYKISLDTMEL
jgi:hypothetical protein